MTTSRSEIQQALYTFAHEFNVATESKDRGKAVDGVKALWKKIGPKQVKT
jgi:hypothetical protein